MTEIKEEIKGKIDIMQKLKEAEQRLDRQAGSTVIHTRTP